MKKYALGLLCCLAFFSLPQEKNAQYVGSKKSDKYHYTSCEWAQKISPSNLRTFKSVGDAVGAGYVACKVCRPPAKATTSNSQSVSPTPSKKKTETYSGRCQATTKKDAQCKRNAKAGSRYCWQHG